MITKMRVFPVVALLLFVACAEDLGAPPDDSPVPTSTERPPDEPVPKSTVNAGSGSSSSLSVTRDDLRPVPTDKSGPPSVTAGTSIDPGLDQLASRAVADLAVRLDVDPASIQLVSSELVVWPNQGLGCPDPALRYPDEPVDGSRIVLKHNDRLYEYETGGSQIDPILCD